MNIKKEAELAYSMVVLPATIKEIKQYFITAFTLGYKKRMREEKEQQKANQRIIGYRPRREI